ncbi:nucleotidyltransferase family protein [Salinarimonas soli]|uniref:Nucleotidyltransferase family protein n=1 Tax=Salinarimonas soli TaxID=1638099 RepID=A0A5B2W1S8_9HYPH|nr:nucleotidyltransferase family protein [Salinarimonas soli]KAA2244169.1 nucleotidyltransferase family protein [Salinarimonas soli]
MSVAALVLAAGRGSRFGEAPKLLAELDGRPLVRHVADAALASRASPVLAVTGHRADAIGAALDDLPVRLLHNPAYSDGLSTSLRAGFAALAAEAEAVVVLLADMPRVTPALIDGLIEAWEGAGRPVAAVPVADGRRGNPVLLSATLAPAIARLTGDHGAGPLLRGLEGVLEVPVAGEGVLLDIDTPDALRALG